METAAAAAAGCPAPHPTASDPPIAVPPKPYSSCRCRCRCRERLPSMDRLQQQATEKDEADQRSKTIRLSKNALILLSVLAVATAAVSWYSAGEPALLVWRLSLLLCCAAFIAASRLLELDATAMLLATISSGFAAALSADALDPTVGVLLAHLTSHLAAGVLGNALARHRQHHGLEVTPATAPPPKKQKREDFYALIIGWCYMGVVTVACAAAMAWVVWHRAEYPTEYLVLHAFVPMAFLLLLWSMFLGVVLLRGVFIGEAGLGWLGGLGVSVGFEFLLSWMVLGDVGAMVVTSLGMLVWTGWFGYTLRVYDSFKHEEWCWWGWTCLAGKVSSRAEKGGVEQTAAK